MRLGAPVQREQGQSQAAEEENSRQNGRGAGQRVCRSARAEQAAQSRSAAPHAQRAAFGALKKDNAYQRDRDDQLDNNEDVLHRVPNLRTAHIRLRTAQGNAS